MHAQWVRRRTMEGRTSRNRIYSRLDVAVAFSAAKSKIITLYELAERSFFRRAICSITFFFYFYFFLFLS